MTHRRCHKCYERRNRRTLIIEDGRPKRVITCAACGYEIARFPAAAKVKRPKK